MADEENTTANEVDDWLADFEEAEQASAGADPTAILGGSDDVSQDDLDALLGLTGSSEPVADEETGEIDQNEIDALLGGGDAPPAEEAGGEIDQSEIDALLGGGDAPSAAEAGGGEVDQSDIDALFAGSEADAPPAAEAGGGEVDQSDIDALFADNDEPAGAAPAEDSAGEVDQSDIDSLFADSGDEPLPEETAAAEAPQEAASSDIDQDEIDALFGDMEGAAPVESDPTEEMSATVEDELDSLFGDLSEETMGGDTTAFHGEEVDFSEILEGGRGDDESFSLNEEDFGLAEDTGDFTLEADAAAISEDIFADDEATQVLPDFGDNTATGGAAPEKKKFVPPAFLEKFRDRRVMGGLLLLLFLAGGGYWYTKQDKQPAIIDPEAAGQMAEDGKPLPPVNMAPQVAGGEFQLDPEGNQLALQLTGEDFDNDPLTFEIITPPEHGELTGEAPNLAYIPGKTFAGEDRFTFQANDGKDLSEPATIMITGPNLAALHQGPPPSIGRTNPMVLARDLSLSATSTKPMVIDWQKVWALTNDQPFSKQVQVEIVGKNMRGKLNRVSQFKHRYTPDPYFSGKETINYRFKKSGLRSKVRTLTLNVKMGDPPPQIRVAGLAETLVVGDKVVLDASATRDDAPDSLTFSWQQLSGVPVQLVPMNQEGSKVSFVVPSTFRNGNTELVLSLSVLDQTGQLASSDYSFNTMSRRQAALWRGVNGGVQRAPDCPQGNCPGELLPWPFPN